MCLSIDLPWSWSSLCWDVVAYRLLSILVWLLLVCSCAQASPGLGIGSAVLWFCSDFPWSWSSICWAVIIHRLPQFLSCLCWAMVFLGLPPDLVLPLLGCGCAKATPVLCLMIAGLWLCTCFLPVLVLPLLGCDGA